jgi:RimJ/RimL family protein N-acetyltransferase
LASSPLNGKVEVGYAIVGIVAKNNRASARVLEKSGFVLQEKKMGTMHGCPKLQRIYKKTFA